MFCSYKLCLYLFLSLLPWETLISHRYIYIEDEDWSPMCLFFLHTLSLLRLRLFIIVFWISRNLSLNILIIFLSISIKWVTIIQGHVHRHFDKGDSWQVQTLKVVWYICKHGNNSWDHFLNGKPVCAILVKVYVRKYKSEIKLVHLHYHWYIPTSQKT